MKKGQGVLKGDQSDQKIGLGNENSYTRKSEIIFLGYLEDIVAWSSTLYLRSLMPL